MNSFERAEQAWLTPPEDKVVGYCNHCGGEIYQGQDAYIFDGEMYCEKSCIWDYLDNEIENIVAGEE